MPACAAPASSHWGPGEEEGERSRACGFLSTPMAADSESAHYRKEKNHHHRHQKRKLSYKQKDPVELQRSYKQNASLLRQACGTGGIQAAGKLRKGGAKKAMEPSSSSSESSDDAPRTKLVVRHLPPSLSEKAFTESIPPQFSGRFDWISFSPGKPSKKRSTSRAYIDFKHPEDVSKFIEEFNGHLFVNEKGKQYKALVEYAPHQEVPKPFPEVDTEEGSISEDPKYLEFLDASAKPIELLPSAEVQLQRKEAEKRARLAAGTTEPVVVTPLMEYVRRRRAWIAQNLIMANKKKSASGRSPSLANSIISSKQASKKSSANVKCVASEVKPSAKLTYASSPLREANHCKEVPFDAKRKAVFEVGGKVVLPERSLTEIVQNDQTFGASRQSGSCRQIRKDQKLQHTDAGRKCKQSTGFRSSEKQVWVAKSASGSVTK